MKTILLSAFVNVIALRVINGEVKLSDIRNQYGSEFAAKVATADPRKSTWVRRIR